jgi:hypothetical protein
MIKGEIDEGGGGQRTAGANPIADQGEERATPQC